jgi:hypothetical protein
MIKQRRFSGFQSFMCLHTHFFPQDQYHFQSENSSSSCYQKRFYRAPTNDQSYLLISASQNFNGFDKHIMENVKLIDASPKGTVTFEFLIDERYTNINGVMHGGAAGVIFDMCTTTALGPLARPGFWEWASFLFILTRFCSKLVIENGTDEMW